MKYEFDSLYFEKRKRTFLKILLFIVLGIVAICVLIKLLMNDLRFSDISGILFSIYLIFFHGRKLWLPKTIPSRCTMIIEEDKISISHKIKKNDSDIINVSTVNFNDITDIMFKEEGYFCINSIRNNEIEVYVSEEKQEIIFNELKKICIEKGVNYDEF